MKLLRVSAFVCLVACATTNAWAQYGLYGAPEMLHLQPVPAAATTNNTFVAPSAYQVEPASSSPVAGNAPSSATLDNSQPMQMAAGPVNPALPPVPAVPANTTPMGQPWSGPVPPALDPGYQPSYMPCVQGGNAAGNGNAAYGACSGAVNQYQQAASGLNCEGCNGCQWYGSVLALFMTRDHGNKLWTSYQSGVEANQIMNTQEAAVGWEWGTEITFGRSFCCNQYSIEATYWTLHEFDGFACASVPGGHVDTPLYTNLMYYHSEQAQDWFDGAEEHRLWRVDEVHNVELNFIRNRLLSAGCGCPLSVDLLAGLRYFRFREDLTWGTLHFGCVWGENSGADEAYVNDEIANNLVGGQIGFNLEYQACHCLKFFVTPKIGIYDNIIQNNFGSQLGNGCIATQNSYPGLCYPVHSSANSFSVLTQIDVGADWQITQQLSARVGWRLLAATGMGLADAQIPPYLNDIPAIQDIDRNGHLILYGGFAGLTYCF